MRTDDNYWRIAIPGVNKTGKSTAVKKIIKKLYNARTDKVLIYAKTGEAGPKIWRNVRELKTEADFRRWKSGIAIYYNHDNPKEGLNDIIRYANKGYLQPGAIVFDDCYKYLTSHATDNVKEFLIDNRHFKLDMFFIVHSWMQFPKFARAFFNGYMIFKTMDTWTLKDFQDMDFPYATGLYEKYIEVMKDESFYANRFVNANKMFAEFRSNH